MFNQSKHFMFNQKNQTKTLSRIVKAGKVGAMALTLGFALNSTSLKADDEMTPMEILDQKVETQSGILNKLSKFKVSGYIQAQYQYAGIDADGTNFKLTNRANAYDQLEEQGYGRFGLRRGRIKFTYEDGLVQGVFQPDFTEKGIGTDRNVVVFKDAYISVKDP